MSVNYQSSFYMGQFTKRLNEQRLSCMFCDVILIADNTRFPAHRNVLAASSDYFKVMFNINMMEKHHSEIVLYDVTAEALECILNYIYSGILEVKRDTVVDLLYLSLYLMMFDVADFCWQYFVTTLDLHNCIERKLIADKLSSNEIANQVTKFVLQHFMKLDMETLLGAPVLLVKQLFLHKHLHVEKEIDILHKLLQLSSHHKDLEFFFDSIRFSFLNITRDQLCDILRSYGILENTKVYEQVVTSFLMNTGIKEARLSYKKEDVILCVGGQTTSSVLNRVSAFSPSRNQWYELTAMSHPRRCFGLLVINNNLFAIGGTMEMARDQPVPFIEQYNGRDDCWEEIYSTSSILFHQNDASIAVFRGSIVFTGGFTMETLCSVVEMNPNNGEWCYLPCMNTAREGHVVVTDDLSIYVIGGMNESGVLNSVEKYDVETGVWCDIEPMTNKRHYACAVWFNKKLYVFGGCDGDTVLSSSEVYDPCENCWTILPCMSNARMKFGITVHENYAYIIGGMTGSRGPMIADVETFNFSDLTWSNVSSLNEAVMEVNCATVNVFYKYLK